MVRISKSKEYYRGNYFTIVVFRLVVAFFFLWLSRIFFYFFNTRYFGHLPADELLRIFLFGIRFDLSTLFTINLAYIVMMTLPWPFRRLEAYRNIAGVLYYFPNLAAIALNMADIVYFRFTQKRMSGDIFDFVVKDISIRELLPRFLKDFWPYFLLYAAMALIFVLLARKISFSRRRFTEGMFMYYTQQGVSFILALVIAIVGIRGGLQLKPVKIISAAKYTKPRNVPMVLNTPFTIIKTIKQQVAIRVDWLDQATADSLFNPVFDVGINHETPEYTTLTGKNVVVIVMESLSAEHVGALNRHLKGYEGFTPFLDSLMQHSLVYNGFANTKQSIEGIPAIVASLPGLLDRNYINSPYSVNEINSLASLLLKNNYHTSFFHGGDNGTMDFDRFAKLAGFEHYHGRNEYQNDGDFDGCWGIFDEPFFDYFIKNLDQTPQPFMSLFFSLSAHHPYTIPPEHQGRFRKGKLEIQEAIMYADFALKTFFEKASAKSWYSNTLFVITADHTSEAYLPEYQTQFGLFRIPIVFFDPEGNLPAEKNITVSQVDIMPSVLALIHYDQPFVAFGQNIFAENQPAFAVIKINGIFQIIQEEYLLEFDGEKSISLFHVTHDKLLQHNLLATEYIRAGDMELLLKAYLQQYYKRLDENRMTAK